MNGLSADLSEAVALAEALKHEPVSVRVALCPPATLVERMSRAVAGSAVLVGGEDCHAEASGAFTGDISAEMLAEAGARLVIVGHSERRAGHGETDAMVAAKAVAAVRAGLEPIICVGETLAEREAGRALEVVTGQIAGSVRAALGSSAVTVAYEPVWAIGTGLTPTIAQIEEIHVAVRAALGQALGAAGGSVAILYGGSVKPSNAVEILKAAEVGGALVGGASLKAADFMQIVRAV
jgi:triosephosphate isomerase